MHMPHGTKTVTKRKLADGSIQTTTQYGHNDWTRNISWIAAGAMFLFNPSVAIALIIIPVFAVLLIIGSGLSALSGHFYTTDADFGVWRPNDATVCRHMNVQYPKEFVCWAYDQDGVLRATEYNSPLN